MIPSDIRGRQSDVLEMVLPKIQHSALRARIADIVWTNDLRKGGVAKIAIETLFAVEQAPVSQRSIWLPG
jgi:hypothetical protein